MQPHFEGMLVDAGRMEIRCRMALTPTSMASLWLVGFEDLPKRCGEICVFEVFGSALRPGSAEVGMGLHPFRDPELTEDFSAQRHDLEVGDWHDYAVTWADAEAVWKIDDREVRRSAGPPPYPMQLMLAVFDFPEQGASPSTVVPRLEVDRISWTRA